MDTNSTDAFDNDDNSPELLSAEEELSSGNGRLAIIVGVIVAVVVLGYMLLPAQTTRRIAAAVPIMQLGEATVTGSRPVEEVAATPAETAATAASKADATAKTPGITPKTAAAVAPATAARAAAEEEAEAKEEAVETAAPVAVAAPEPVEAAPAMTNMTGRVLNEDGRPLAGATVMLKGSKKVASTDANGNYSLEVPANGDNTLLYGYGGYEDQLVRTRSAKGQNVTLVPKETSRRRRR
ncbi:carboxypeptidase-like regulatory domain-containing protein [Hymenobacter rubripertinctus]|uniref:Carboxypeptidase-like regulatory domain-containing protein n=1 Tax=Hymenobacter rubripertinctus TaxID=2029981 RepID=A0A418R7V1_9BACT|nr:carboxypeptidase-like regulatory domain-containing protein [Hymenobacter rubripertinctus]RIY13371.1 carboxypeptidase-like regulatory domain-containing protein [Hymenobacter rubripertinctus]